MNGTCERLETAVAGDVDDVRELVLTGGPGAAVLASVLASPGVTLSAKVWNDDVAAVPLTLTLVDAAKRIVGLNLGNSSGWLPTAVPGEYLVDLKVNQWTFPSNGPLLLRVRASG